VLDDRSSTIEVGIVIYYLLGIKLISFLTIQKAINKPPITYRYGNKLSTIGDDTAPTEASKADPVVVANNICVCFCYQKFNKKRPLFFICIYYIPLTKYRKGKGGG
jgi:hypothetical protein